MLSPNISLVIYPLMAAAIAPGGGFRATQTYGLREGASSGGRSPAGGAGGGSAAHDSRYSTTRSSATSAPPSWI